MILPDLKQYRSDFQGKGVRYPLPAIPVTSDGLLKLLPTAPQGKTGWPWTEETDPKIYTPDKSWPKLTIVTPSYNQGRFIEETLRAVLLQNYPNLEYIVIDGGSSDNSAEVIRKYSPWISYWHSEKDRGQGHAINLGFSLASGEYYAWINSDDFYVKNVFFKVMNIFRKKKSAFVYGYNTNWFMKEQKYKLYKVLPFWDYFIRFSSLAQPSCFWKAKIHQPIWEELHCAMDFELWMRIVRGNKRTLIKEALSVAKIHDQAKTYNPEMKSKWKEDNIKIFSEDGHGVFHDFKKRSLLYSLRKKIYIISDRVFRNSEKG